MCGISGIFDTRAPAPVSAALLTDMNDTMVHRGPDGFGTHIEPGVGLGHRRLSIIDLEGGKQPMANEDATIVVTFNGEIYNFQALREELISKGYRFRTNSDTEAIVHGYAEWGADCVKRFNGMFALAVYDKREQTLFLARDRLGIKPLYYGVVDDGRVLFGSELKVLLRHPSLGRGISPRAIEDYFTFGYVPDPDTILEGVHKLAPGHTLTLKRGQGMPSPRQYWDVPFEAGSVRSEADLETELLERLEKAVRRRMIADVPLGAFLSGGVDSSAVVALMTGLSDKPVSACSISFGDPEFNEVKYARQVADHLGTELAVRQVDEHDFDLLDQLGELYDEPYADSSAMPTYRVCKLAREGVKVALSGDGGDENFAGYRRYRWHAYEEKVRRFLPQSIRGPLFGTLGRVYPKLDRAPKIFRAKSTLEAIGRDTTEGYLHGVSIFPAPLREKLLSARVRSDLQGYRSIDRFKALAAQAPTDDSTSLVQYLDFKTYLPGDILTKVDRASMAHGLEVRVPFLDHEFVEWVSGVDVGMKLRGREGKYILKRALTRKLPRDILYREKMGFAVPLGSWMRGPLRERIEQSVCGERMADSGFFEPAMLREIVDEHVAGRRDYTPVIWGLLMFDGFLGRIDAGAGAAPARVASG
ncbi:MAG: XrtA/PEP-CTERM system amidotransferase [Pseudomonadota bacterium]